MLVEKIWTLFAFDTVEPYLWVGVLRVVCGVPTEREFPRTPTKPRYEYSVLGTNLDLIVFRPAASGETSAAAAAAAPSAAADDDDDRDDNEEEFAAREVLFDRVTP